MSGSTYKEAGVDIDAGDALVERIKPIAASTRIPGVIADVGGFAGLFSMPPGMREPVLVSGTDGVGTKLKLAFAADQHETIGIDLVAMSANDVAVTGARPLFFLDYYATGRLDVERAEKVIKGIARGCRLAGCALLGGETAELPGMYADGEYDLAGFVVGVVERSEILDGRTVAEGDAILGLPSSGLHSNGYSLARKVLMNDAGLSLDAPAPGIDGPLVEALLAPTHIYVGAIGVAKLHRLKAAAHITGGGLPGNLPRVLPPGLGARLDPGCWKRPAILDLIQKLGRVSDDEMRRTFNDGIGMAMVLPPERVDPCIEALSATGVMAARIGVVVAAQGDARVTFAA